MYQEIGKNFFVLRSKEEDFHRNIYLKKFDNKDGTSLNMIFDPGTKLDMKELLPFLTETIGGIKNVHIIFLSHQDPDLTANAPVILQSAPKSILITSLDTWRLVKMYGIPEHRVKTIESFNSLTVKFKKSGLSIKFIPARYCHFRGAAMVYDYESRILFTGDFFAGVNTRKSDGIYATEESWEGIKLFHQLYMPTNKAIKTAIESISMLNPFPEIIAPQHGDIIKGEMVTEFMTRLMDLPVGMDLIESTTADSDLVMVGLNNFFELVNVNFPEIFETMVMHFKKQADFTTPFEVKNGRITQLKTSPDTALLQVADFLEKIEDEDLKTSLKGIMMDSLDQVGISFSFGKEFDKTKKEHKSVDMDNMFDM